MFAPPQSMSFSYSTTVASLPSPSHSDHTLVVQRMLTPSDGGSSSKTREEVKTDTVDTVSTLDIRNELRCICLLIGSVNDEIWDRLMEKESMKSHLKQLMDVSVTVLRMRTLPPSTHSLCGAILPLALSSLKTDASEVSAVAMRSLCEGDVGNGSGSAVINSTAAAMYAQLCKSCSYHFLPELLRRCSLGGGSEIQHGGDDVSDDDRLVILNCLLVLKHILRICEVKESVLIWNTLLQMLNTSSSYHDSSHAHHSIISFMDNAHSISHSTTKAVQVAVKLVCQRDGNVRGLGTEALRKV